MFSKIVLLTALLNLNFFQSAVLNSAPAPNNEVENNDDDRNLKILSWNIYMLPWIIPGTHKIARAHAIVEELKKSDFDIIVFQEAFLPEARKIISEGLGDYVYKYGPFNKKAGFKICSGVWIISKVKMDVLKTIQFKDCAFFDCAARKGAALLEGTWNDKPFQLMGTHLQAEEYPNIRVKQMDSIYRELLSPYRREGVPQIICGDMNTESEIKDRYCSMLDCFGAENGDITGVEKSTYDGVNNDLAQSFGVKNKTTYDYILVRNNGTRIKSVKRFVSILKKGKRFLSDHYGIACELKF